MTSYVNGMITKEYFVGGPWHGKDTWAQLGIRELSRQRTLHKATVPVSMDAEYLAQDIENIEFETHTYKCIPVSILGLTFYVWFHEGSSPEEISGKLDEILRLPHMVPVPKKASKLA